MTSTTQFSIFPSTALAIPLSSQLAYLLAIFPAALSPGILLIAMNPKSLLMKSKPHVAVIGAGAFGGWTALHLLERGARVTLLDAWGPGNSRASSGGETRIMRGTYGPDQPYSKLAARALKLWDRNTSGAGSDISCTAPEFSGWPAAATTPTSGARSRSLREARIKFQQLSTKEMKKRWPQINFSDVRWGIYEPECGYLDARASCQAVVDAFVDQGGVLPAGRCLGPKVWKMLLFAA